MLPRRVMSRTRIPVVAGVLMALSIGTYAGPAAASRPGDWQPSTWTGVALGAPVPGDGLSAPMPAALPAVPYLPISYDGQSTCDPSAKLGAVRMGELIRATYGGAEVIGIPRGCDVGGRSEHKEGRAVDWMVDVRKPNERAKAEAFLNWLLGPDSAGRPSGNAFMLGVMYIGWHDRMWRGYAPERGWSELKGCFSKPEDKYDNYCHRNHIHISLTWAGAAGSTLPDVAAPPAEPVVPETPPRPPAPAQPGVDDDSFMSVGSELGFMTDEATPLEAGEVRTVDLPPVPLDASSALVLVTTRKGDRKGTLRIGMVEAKSAVDVRVAKRKQKTSIIQVPVANGGVQVAAPKRSSVHVRVDVLGYTTAGGEHGAVAVPAHELTKQRFAGGDVAVVKVRGVGTIPKKPTKATAVLLRITTKGAGEIGRFAAYPVGGADLGTTSAAVVAKGRQTSVVAADIGDDGLIALASSVPAKATVEIVGYVKG